MISEHVTVQATRNLSDKVLKGCTGAVVFVYNDPKLAYEVEFIDNEGYTLDLLTVEPSDIKKI